MHFSSRFTPLMMTLLVGLVGCTKPDDGNHEGANFFVKDVSVEGAQLIAHENNSFWRTARQATYTLRACIVDQATQIPSRGHGFEVRSPEGVVYEALSNTDPSGCFTWQEEFPFNEFASRTYFVPYQREIVGTGVLNGSRTIEFAVNPWALGENARDRGPHFVFLHDGIRSRDRIDPSRTVGKTLSNLVLSGDYKEPEVMATGQSASGAARVWVSNVSLKSIRRSTLGNGVSMDVELSLRPIIRMLNTDGNILTRKIDSGLFDITAHLVVTDTGVEENSKMIITEVSGASTRARGDVDVMSSVLRVKWDRRAHIGNVTLALKVTPIGIQGLESFEGLFELGGLDALSGNSSANLLPNCSHPTEGSGFNLSGFNTSDRPCQNIQAFLKDANNYEKLVEEGYASTNEPFIFDVLRLRFMSVLSGETATQRVVGYSAQTCINNRFDGSRVMDVPFVIEYLDEKDNVIPEMTQVKPTNPMGCLIWNAKIHHAYYGPEEFIWHKVRIRTEKSQNSFAKIKRFALNPWDDKFTFGWDEEEFAEEFLRAKKVPSRFFLPSFDYHTVRFLYNIDPFMELEVKKTVLMDLRPRVLRYAGIVNARKQTEPLRDGIYLLKVAIQKDFLDPTERALDLSPGQRASISQNGQQVPSIINQSLGKVTPREYITTDQSLVRVVDGHLIHPMELTMRDLRLMRVRSNLLIQLETVDERKIQAHDVFNRLMKSDLEVLTAKRERERLAQAQVIKDRAERLGENPTADQLRESEKALNEAHAEEASQIRTRYRNAFIDIREQLERLPFINNNFDLDPELLKPIHDVLEANDFTELTLPAKDEADLNLFREDRPDLRPRTFVGPVIFLSNAYSDSMRATDNLDEANCTEIEKVGQRRFIEADNDKVAFEDEEILKFELEESMLVERSGMYGRPALQNSRQNRAYRYSRYYGALTHLCGTQVDDLLNRQRVYEEDYQQIMPLASTKANMARSFGLDYVSLSDEPLDRLPPDGCDKNPSCQRLRSESYSRDQINQLLSYDFQARQAAGQGFFTAGPLQNLTSENLIDHLLPPLVNINGDKSSGQEVLISSGLKNPVTAILSCSVLSDLTLRNLKKAASHVGNEFGFRAKMALQRDVRTAREIFRKCVDWEQSSSQAIIVDDKLKVYETGADYVFRGGLQMNINVGASTSFSRSQGLSGTAGVDPWNFIKGGLTIGGAVIGAMSGPAAPVAAPAGAAAGAALGGMIGNGIGTMVQGLKASASGQRGASESVGTSVSPGTYLVGQIAKFDVPITLYDQCRTIKWSDEFAESFSNQYHLPEDVQHYLKKGLLICSNSKSNPPIRVAENYFYFTQHFTEGDMLDQADLYNHPWLLAIRGVRDYGVFLDNMNAQEVPDLWKFRDQTLGKPTMTERTWPIDQMAKTYRQQLPSFPGFYSVPGSAEEVSSYPLNDRFSLIESDINAEVSCQLEKTPTRLATCSEKMSGLK